MASPAGSVSLKAAERRSSRRWPLLPILLLILVLSAPEARSREPLLIVAKNTLLGGVTGLVLGGTLTLVVDDEDRMDVVRWGIVTGTFAGFGLGVWQAIHPDDDLFAAAEGACQPLGRCRPGCLAVRDAQFWLGLRRHARGRENPLPAAHDVAPGWAIRVSLLRLSW